MLRSLGFYLAVAFGLLLTVVSFHATTVRPATAFSAARAIAASGPVARDLVLIVTDGEEAGLFGARAVFASHPIAKRPGVVLNLEHAPRDGVVLAFDVPAGADLDWRLQALSDAWPASARLPARPAAIMAWQNSESSAVIAEGKVSW